MSANRYKGVKIKVISVQNERSEGFSVNGMTGSILHLNPGDCMVIYFEEGFFIKTSPVKSTRKTSDKKMIKIQTLNNVYVLEFQKERLAT